MYLTVRYFMDCKIFQFGSVQASRPKRVTISQVSSLAAVLIQGHQK